MVRRGEDKNGCACAKVNERGFSVQASRRDLRRQYAKGEQRLKEEVAIRQAEDFVSFLFYWRLSSYRKRKEVLLLWMTFSVLEC